jgi:hypothetical protein
MDQLNDFFYKLNEDGTTEPCSMEEFGQNLDIDVRGIDRTVVRGGYVSTVFLGSNHAFRGGEPLLFETMFFADDSDHPRNQDMFRYRTKAEAEEGHKMMVEVLGGETTLSKVVGAVQDAVDTVMKKPRRRVDLKND